MEDTAASESPGPNLRTAGDLAVKTITTHLFALGNYAYMSTLQQRSTRNGLHVLRVVLLAFVPTLIIIEFVNSLVQSLINFIRNQIDEAEEDKNVWFHLSAGLGVHASMLITNQATKKDETRKVPLLKLDPTLAERERILWSWAWAGKMFATLFALMQAIGTIVMWVRRMDHGWSQARECLGFDHRNGAMGIASTICSVGSIFVLLLRYEWSVARALQSPSTERLHRSRITLLLQTFLAMTLHMSIACMANGTGNRWLYTSSGVFFRLFGIFSDPWDDWSFVSWGWETVLLAIFVLVFRKEIGARLGTTSIRYQTWIRHRSWKRVKALLKVGLAIWFCADIVRLFVSDIINAVSEKDNSWFWW